MKITVCPSPVNEGSLKSCPGWLCPQCSTAWYWFVEKCRCGYENDEYSLKGEIDNGK